jgi:hypothetical protein
MTGFSTAGFIGFAKESSGGTAVAASRYIEALSENMQLDISRFDFKNIHGAFYEPDDMAGIQQVKGSLVFAAHPVEFGYFLAGAMGVQTSSVVASGALWTTQHTMRTTDWDASFAQQPFSFEIFRDVGSSQQYTGCCISQLQMEVKPNQDLRVTANLMGRDSTNIAATTPTFTSSPAQPFAFDTCSVAIAGTGSELIEDFTITVNNQLEAIGSLRNAKSIRAIRRNGPQQIRVSGQMAFENITEYNNFINQTEQAFTLSFTRASSFGLTVALPRVVYTTYPLQMQGRGRIQVGFDGIARYHVGSQTAIKVSLTTTQSYF